MKLYIQKTNRLLFKGKMFTHLKGIGVKLGKGVAASCERELARFNESADHRFNNYLGYPNGIFPGFLPRKVVDKLLLNIGDWRGNKYLGPNTHGYELEATNYLKEIFQFPADQKEWGNSCTGSSVTLVIATSSS